MPPPPEGNVWPRTHPLGFQALLREAIADIASTGYVSSQQIDRWITLLRNAAEREIGPEAAVDAKAREAMSAVFRRLIDAGHVTNYVPGVSRLALAIIKPQLRAELDRRILASADLIKLHRREAVERTLARLMGWSTSIPEGGTGVIDKREVRSGIGKSLAQFRFERRRCEIDQGHKLIANISDIVAQDQGAIAAEWHSHGEHDRSYDARKVHLARAGKVFAIRGNWAIEAGLMHKGAGYTDEIEMVGQLPFCRCFYRYILSPRRLPDEMLTQKGRDWVARGRLGLAA